MHGKVRSKTWTTIAQTINLTDTQFEVSEAVDWEIGEEIVVASTDYDHTHAERRTITGVSGNTITVDSAFEYEHFSGIESFGSDRAEMRA